MESRISRREGWRNLAAAPESGWPEAFQGTCRAGGGLAKRKVCAPDRRGAAPPQYPRLPGRSGRSSMVASGTKGRSFRPRSPAGVLNCASRGGHGQVSRADRPGGRPGGGPRLRPRVAAGVRSQPSGRRDARADGRPVLGGLQPLRDQRAGSSADPQRLHAQSGGDPEELQAFI